MIDYAHTIACYGKAIKEQVFFPFFLSLRATILEG